MKKACKISGWEASRRQKGNTRMQNEMFDSPDESEWDEEEPYYDWDDPDWREDWDDDMVSDVGDASQGNMRR